MRHPLEQLLRIASGERLAFTQADLHPRGHAFEARVYAEDAARGFLPTGGVVRLLHEPDDLPDVRVDSSLLPGIEIGSSYDPMLTKIVAWAPDRETARRTLDAALARTCILGVTTNIAFLRTVLADADVIAGELDTGLVERIAARLPAPAVPGAVAIAAALLPRLHTGTIDDPWLESRGWRLGPPAWSSWRAHTSDGTPVEVRLRASGDAWQVAVDGGEIVRVTGARIDDRVRLDIDGETVTFIATSAAATTWIGADGETWMLTEPGPAAPGLGARPEGEMTITSPMPGTVVTLRVASGQHVSEGEAIIVVEAMKMEHTLLAPCDALVSELLVDVAELVALGQPLVILEANTAPEPAPETD